VNRWTITVVSLLALLLGLWFLTRDAQEKPPVRDRFLPRPASVIEPDRAPAPPAAAKEPAARPAPALRAPLPRPQAPAEDVERQTALRAQLAASLDEHKELAVVRSLTCEPGGVCHVELAVSDLNAFMPIFARLGEPGGGLSDDNTMMVLQSAEAGTLRFQLIEKGTP
jgi:hypothetical protein